jgi:putative transposase
MALAVEHRQHKGLNNRAANSHRPTRRWERITKRFKSVKHAHRFLSFLDQIPNLFNIPYSESVSAEFRRASRERALAAWCEISKARRCCLTSPLKKSPSFQRFAQVDGAARIAYFIGEYRKAERGRARMGADGE